MQIAASRFRQELQGPDPRTAGDERQARAQERPQVLAIEAKLKDRVSINMDKQPSARPSRSSQNYTGLNIVLDPKALGEEGYLVVAGELDGEQCPSSRRVLKLLLRPLGLTYKLEDEVVLITSPQADQSQTYPKTYYVGDLVMPPDHGPQTLTPTT